MSEEEHKEEGQSTNPTEGETPTENEKSGEEDTTLLKEQIEKAQETIRQLTARAKKAEAQNKRTDLHTPEASITENVDERILLSQGVTGELLVQLKKVARFNETDLITAQQDPLYIAMKEKIEQEKRDKEASLGASKSSGGSKAQKDFTTQGLKPEDHRALWQKATRG